VDGGYSLRLKPLLLLVLIETLEMQKGQFVVPGVVTFPSAYRVVEEMTRLSS
jgi:hypothetical protein